MPDAPGGDYALTSYHFKVPAIGLDVIGTGGVSVVNDFPTIDGPLDQYVVAFAFSPYIQINGITLIEFAFNLGDPTGTIFSDESIPVVPPELSRFADLGDDFALIGQSLHTCQVCRNSGVIDTLVPEPSTPAMLLTGLMLLIAVQLVVRRLKTREQRLRFPRLNSASS